MCKYLLESFILLILSIASSPVLGLGFNDHESTEKSELDFKSSAKPTSAISCDKYLAYEDFSAATTQNIVKDFKQLDTNLGETRDQDSIGYCYAYSGADMLEHWLKSKNRLPVHNQISALALGIHGQRDDLATKASDYNTLALKRKLYEPQIDLYRERLSDLFVKRAAIEELLTEAGKDIDSIDIEKIARLESELKNTSKELSFYIDAMGNLEEELKSGSFREVPEGGFTHSAIKEAWPLVCLESEISSSDEGIKNYYSENRDLFLKSEIIQPENLEGALAFLSVGMHDANVNTCSLYTISNLIFGNSSFETVGDFLKFTSELKVYESILTELLKKSCSERFVDIKPEIATVEVSGNLPLSVDSEKVFTLIDESLNDGRVAEISYHADIFYREDLGSQKESRHSSLIVGSMNLCNEKYYVVRNSWGEGSCEDNKSRFRFSESKSEKFRDVRQAYRACLKSSRDKIKASGKFTDCNSLKCFEEEDFEHSQYERKCKEDLEYKEHRSLQAPYFCDDRGNFIVSKSQLKKGMYAASTITNY